MRRARAARPPPRARPARRSSLGGADLLARVRRRLLGVVGHALRVLAAALLGGVRRRGRDVRGDLLAAVERLLAGLGRLGLHLVGDGADLLVLDARGRDQHAGEEADRRRTDHQAERILLGDAHRALGVVLYVAT